jgi:hypothetical protein
MGRGSRRLRSAPGGGSTRLTDRGPRAATGPASSPPIARPCAHINARRASSTVPSGLSGGTASGRPMCPRHALRRCRICGFSRPSRRAGALHASFGQRRIGTSLKGRIRAFGRPNRMGTGTGAGIRTGPAPPCRPCEAAVGPGRRCANVAAPPARFARPHVRCATRRRVAGPPAGRAS